MRLGEAELDHDAFLACLTHTLTTEQEEVMGLLLGDIEECNGVRVARVWDAITLRRNCKQRDRVEISAEQLVAASQEAEEIGNRINKPTRVIGWYHSHPHITVLPSHVDIGTQKSYQMMEGGFLGLIFSVFNTDQNHKGRIQVIAFQSGISEEQSAGGINFPDGMIQIPLRLAPSLGSTPNLFLRLANLQEILLEEAHDSFLQSFPQGEVHSIQRCFNSAVYDKTLCLLLEFGFYPTLQVLEDLEVHYKRVKEQQNKEKAELLAEIERLEGNS